MEERRLGETGLLYCTKGVIENYARYCRISYDEAGLELTELLMGAKQTGTPKQSTTGTERWRLRSGQVDLDITARVVRKGSVLQVIHIHIRNLNRRK